MSGLARSEETARALSQRGIAFVRGALDEGAALSRAVRGADATIDAANAGHRGAAEAIGDHAVLADRRLARAAKDAQGYVVRFSYHDRLGCQPLPTPCVAALVAVENVKASLARDGTIDRSADMREALADVGDQHIGLIVRLRQTPEPRKLEIKEAAN